MKILLKYQDMSKIILCGHFNSRVGTLSDFITNDKQDPHFDLIYVDNQHSIPRVCKKDRVINTSGRKLIEICISQNLKIVNGRTNGDNLGQITCYNYKGSSAVDYFIVDDSLFKSILTFKVSPPHFRSSHSMLQLSFRIDRFPNGGWKTK